MYPCKSQPEDLERPKSFSDIFCDNAMRSYGSFHEVTKEKETRIFVWPETREKRTIPKSTSCHQRADDDTSLGVGALALDVAGLLALVAHLLAASGLLRAIAGEVTGLAAVVALGALDAVAWNMD